MLAGLLITFHSSGYKCSLGKSFTFNVFLPFFVPQNVHAEFIIEQYA